VAPGLDPPGHRLAALRPDWGGEQLHREALAEPDAGARLRRLGLLSGIYNLLWAAVVVLMIVRPGGRV
jgi:hypothetical protein